MAIWQALMLYPGQLCDFMSFTLNDTRVSVINPKKSLQNLLSITMYSALSSMYDILAIFVVNKNILLFLQHSKLV